jgi:hypothetical protein
MINPVYLRFPDWKSKAVTLSYDDATKTDERLISIMTKYGLKGTFNVNSGLYEHNANRLSKEQAYELYTNSGMEVSAHGYKHLSVDVLPDMELIKEFAIDKANLEKEYGKIIRGFAYANGIYNDRAVNVLRECGFAYARTVEPTNNFSLPTDWLRWNPTCHHMANNFKDLAQLFFDSKPDVAYRKHPLLFYLWGHSIEFSNFDNWDLIESFAKSISQDKDIWNATNIEICDYVKAYYGLTYSAECDKVLNNSAIDVYLLVGDKKVLAKAGQTTKF